MNANRLLQADPILQAPFNQGQNYDSYSYVLNNPLRYTDPSGYGFFSRLFKGIGKFIKRYWKVIAAVVVTAMTAGSALGWVATWGSTWGTAATATTAATLTTSGAMAVGAMAGAAGGAVAGALITGTLKGTLRGALTGAIAGIAGGYANYGQVSGWGDAFKRVGVAALGGCGAGVAAGGSCSKGARSAAYAQAIMLTADYMAKVTDSYKLKSCEKSNSVCRYNNQGELLTDGSRGTLQITGTSSGEGNFLTNSGMAPEGSGQHLYSENSIIGRYINRISKTHDYINSDISKYFGFQGYDSVTGLWLAGSETYNTMFQLYSFTGMLPAAVYTSAAILAPYPIYQYEQLRSIK